MPNSFLSKITFAFAIACSAISYGLSAAPIWEIGEADNSINDLALDQGKHTDFLKHDFGWEDRVFVIGRSSAKADWPHVLPGPEDEWAGSNGRSVSGWRTQVLNILFELEHAPVSDDWKLVIDFFNVNSSAPPLFKVTVNGQPWKFSLPKGTANITEGKEHVTSIALPSGLIHSGGNEIQITSLLGSWCAFDQIRLEGPDGVTIAPARNVFLRDVRAADYEMLVDGQNAQPLLVDVEHLEGRPVMKVTLDGQTIFNQQLEKGRYLFEVPMPAVHVTTKSHYEIRLDGQAIRSGAVTRSPQRAITAADYVDTLLGTAHSRWMIAPGPWMPFSMVKLSPDNQDTGWQAGYQPSFESIGCFSHIHEWTMGGLGMMACRGNLQTKIGAEDQPDSGYRSRIDKRTEQAGIGLYAAHLTDYNIDAAVTATTRCGFHRYTFNEAGIGRVMVDLLPPTEYPIESKGLSIKKIGDRKLIGYSKQFSVPWERSKQDYIVHFAIEFDHSIDNYGTWSDDTVHPGKDLGETSPKQAGAFVEFDLKAGETVQARVGISLVSVENAELNLQEEIIKPFGWDFDKIVKHQRDTWNDLLGRLTVTSNNRLEKRRFYTNFYRSLCSRSTWSDVDGRWVDATEKVQKLENPDSLALGCDAFWNTFWNLNQLWNLVTPEWSSRWVRSQLAMYDANGWLAKGPAGMEFVPVMVAEHEIPLIVGSYQMGIRDYDAEKAFEAAYKMQTTPGTDVGGCIVGNQYLQTYLEHRYVPSDKGRFSNTLEYSYDDWTLAQFAKALGKDKEYKEFIARGYYWKNAIDTETGYARLRQSDGSWEADFDPIRSGANKQYVEGNAWQLTFFVPQDIPALAQTIGRERFLERLEWGFAESDKMRFNAPNELYWDYPVVHGNQQSMQFAYLFNWVGRPWLTQKWTRAIMDRYYGHGLSNAYLGDEDQGQMSAWFVMSSIGLFQTDGGCRVDPIYEIGSPFFPKVTIDLGRRYGRGQTFTIEAKDVSHQNKYIQEATLNGEPWNKCWFPARELLKGGSLVLQMGPTPNKQWGDSPKASSDGLSLK